MNELTRRKLLQIIGAGVVGMGCGASDDEELSVEFADGGAPLTPPADDGVLVPARVTPTADDMLAEIDTFVIVMMENRSFDHYFGSLHRDQTYANADTVAGTKGTETNPKPGGGKVKIYRTTNFTLADPPHNFAASHKQFNKGKNDQFVVAHAGANQAEVMAFYERSQIPFYYWLADNFTICDHWYASVMGPTWPNRFYLHAGTSAGRTNNTPIPSDFPTTIWDRLKKAGLTGKNYYAGKSAFYAGGFAAKIKAGGINPTAKIASFFKDAKAGKLPNVSYIDPDYGVADDHPARDIRLGQAFVASIYKALAESPQWSRSLLVIIYDEHGGFYDHVAPPKAPDDLSNFEQFGFRVPAILVGPTVKKGYLSTAPYDHTSVLATLSKRFDMPLFGARSEKANVLTDAFDTRRFESPNSAPEIPAAVRPKIDASALETLGIEGQPELAAMVERGEIPAHLTDPRSARLRAVEWLRYAESLGALKLDL